MADLTRNPSEKEVLLPRNTKMEVISISPPKSVGKPVIIKVKTVSDDGARNDAAPTGASYRIGGQQMVKAAGIMFASKAGQALYLKRGPGSDYPGMWAFPGGRLEDGETAAQAAIREVEEEAGFKADPETLRYWTRRIAAHETTGAEPSPEHGVAIVAPVPDAVVLPGDALVIPGEPVDFTTFAYAVDEPFTPTLNDENVGYAWAPLSEPPEPLHPGCRVALARFGMDELDVARAIQSGELTSPQQYQNITLFDIRITGTGAAYRDTIDEHVYRPPEIYLNDDRLDRFNGLPVVWLHPPEDKPVLDSAEFSERIVGTIMLPYIKGDEVWGIAKIYDADAARTMANEQLSTSPGVLFRSKGVNTKLQLDDGSILLFEGKPDLIDHLAICASGVWDKGGAPAGVITSTIEGATDMAEEDMGARKDADEKTEDRKDAGGDKMDNFMSKFDAFCGKVDARMDAMEAKIDKKDSRKDSEDEKPKDEAKKDAAKKDGEAAGEAEEMAADSKKDSEADKEDEARKDAAIEARVLDRLRGFIPKAPTDADYAALASKQARADKVYQAFGDSAPRPLQGEDAISYGRRLATGLKTHSAVWKDTDLNVLPVDALNIAETQIYNDAMAVAASPATVAPGTLRKVSRKLESGHTINEFFGQPSAWMNRMAGPVRQYVKGFNTPNKGSAH